MSFSGVCKHSMRVALSVVIALFSRAVFAMDNIIVKKNLTYGKAGGVDLKLDIAYPKHGSGPFPGLICIHGGGWAYGERDAYLGLIEKAAGKGYVAVTISYRLTGLDPKSMPANGHSRCNSTIANALSDGCAPSPVNITSIPIESV